MSANFELVPIAPLPCPHFIPLVSENFLLNLHALRSLLLGMCGLQIFLHPPVKSWYFPRSLLADFPFPIGSSLYTLKSPLRIKSWQSLNLSQRRVKCFGTKNPQVWNPMLPLSLGAFPSSSCIRHPSSRVPPRAGHRANPQCGQGLFVGDPRAAADPHALPRRRRDALTGFPPTRDTPPRGHQRDRWSGVLRSHRRTCCHSPEPGRGGAPGLGRGHGRAGRGRT